MILNLRSKHELFVSLAFAFVLSILLGSAAHSEWFYDPFVQEEYSVAPNAIRSLDSLGLRTGMPRNKAVEILRVELGAPEEKEYQIKYTQSVTKEGYNKSVAVVNTLYRSLSFSGSGSNVDAIDVYSAPSLKGDPVIGFRRFLRYRTGDIPSVESFREALHQKYGRPLSEKSNDVFVWMCWQFFENKLAQCDDQLNYLSLIAGVDFLSCEQLHNPLKGGAVIFIRLEKDRSGTRVYEADLRFLDLPLCEVGAQVAKRQFAPLLMKVIEETRANLTPIAAPPPPLRPRL
jgi:hypothetical protein